ncbi:DNA-protecting protein DprA [Candidatus Saccharibacteria bacterium]|nr:DNA-protecting protein DprA [Candidatus Saccharibacteria bacterium]
MSTLFTHFFDKINEISPLDHDFTQGLASIALMPKTLYFRGELPENVLKTGSKGSKERRKTVAIVGSRHNTRYGQEVAYKLAYELGKRNVIVVSGLAFGIDSIGHRGCLDAGGTTVAVLGTRIDDIYPRAHMALAREIIEKHGAIISEYSPRGQVDVPLAPAEYLDEITGKRSINQYASFLYRNRIISGLSDIVVVVEAAEKSGSLNTATHALEQGKEVFAVPGNITSPYSQGCNKLIKQGAIPYTEPDDILRLLFPEDYAKKRKNAKKQGLIGDTDVETLILRAIGEGFRNGEEIMKTANLPPEVFNQTITLLEIKGRVHSLGMNHWGLC